MEIYTVAFFGHREVDNLYKLEEELDEQVRSLLGEKEFVEFLVGRNGEFDLTVARVVRRIKSYYRDDNSALILVLPYLTAEYLNNQESFENYNDDVTVYSGINTHPKGAIQARNREMVDMADLVICYLEYDYGGAYQSVKYAKNKGKVVINLAEI